MYLVDRNLVHVDLGDPVRVFLFYPTMRRAGKAEIIFINTTASDDNMNLSPTVPISEKPPSVWPKRVTKVRLSH